MPLAQRHEKGLTNGRQLHPVQRDHPALSPAERKWAKKILAHSAEQRAAITAAEIKLTEDDPLLVWPDFAWEFQKPAGDLWIYSEESGDPHHVGQFVRAFLARFRPKDSWHFTWAETCSRPIVGDFGGGGLFVTAKSFQLFSAHEWLERRKLAFQREVPSSKSRRRRGQAGGT